MTTAWLEPEADARLDTPLVVVDLDRMDANIERMAALRDRGAAVSPSERIRSRGWPRWRPRSVGPAPRPPCSSRSTVAADAAMCCRMGQAVLPFERSTRASGSPASSPTTVISAGSTPTASLSARPPVTEERPGTYVLGDRQQLVLAGDPADDAGTAALVVAATVVSHGARGGFLVDAGARMLGKDTAPYAPGHGMVLGYPNTVLSRVSDHHGIADVLDGAPRPTIGEVVWIVANHACPVVNLVDELVVAQGGRIVDRWPVDARGRNT